MLMCVCDLVIWCVCVCCVCVLEMFARYLGTLDSPFVAQVCGICSGCMQSSGSKQPPGRYTDPCFNLRFCQF